MICILCQQPRGENLGFTHLLFLRKDHGECCRECQSKFLEIGKNHCPNCYKNGRSEVCRNCLYWKKKKITINHKALYQYNDFMKEYISSYKFLGDYYLRWVFAKRLKKSMSIFKDYAIVPIPISAKNLESRKFNQVEGWLEAANLEYINCLSVNESKKQNQSEKNRYERLKTKQFFEIKVRATVPKKILLFDDIFTTGKTIVLASEKLYENGAESIKSFSLIR